MTDSTPPSKRIPPCDNCPWRVQPAGQIPGYKTDLHEGLIRSCQRDQGSVMACHKSAFGDETPCAGYMVQVGYDAIGPRLLAMMGGPTPEMYCDGGAELHETLEDTLAAIQEGDR